MPLSEDEQRILRQIEEQFYESDPKFAQQVGTSSIYRHALRRIRWAVLGLVAGLAFLIATLQIHFLVAFLGFLIMLALRVRHRAQHPSGRQGRDPGHRRRRAQLPRRRRQVAPRPLPPRRPPPTNRELEGVSRRRRAAG